MEIIKLIIENWEELNTDELEFLTMMRCKHEDINNKTI